MQPKPKREGKERQRQRPNLLRAKRGITERKEGTAYIYSFPVPEIGTTI